MSDDSTNGTGSATPEESVSTGPSASKESSGGGGPGKDATLATVAGVVIASGIAYSLYKSFVVGKKKEEPLHHDLPVESFHDEVIEKPKGFFTALDDKAKDSGSGLFWKPSTVAQKKEEEGERERKQVGKTIRNTKEAAEDLGSNIINKVGAVLNKGKKSVGHTVDYVGDKGEQAKDAGYDLYKKAELKAEKGTEQIKDSLGSGTEAVKDSIADSAEFVAEKAEEAKDTGFLWFRKASKEASKGTEAVKEAIIESAEFIAEKGEEAKDAGAAFFEKASSDAGRGAEKVKGSVDKGTNQVKDSVTDSKDFVADQANQTKKTGWGWFRKASSEVEKEADAVKESAEKSKQYAGDKGEQAKDTGRGWFKKAESKAEKDKEAFANETEKAKQAAASDYSYTKEKAAPNFFENVGSGINHGAENVKGAFLGGVKNVENAASAVVNFVLPGGKDKSGDSGFAGKPRPVKGGPGEVIGIKHGDTLFGIARRYGVSLDRLKHANDIWNADYIVAGDTLTIPK